MAAPDCVVGRKDNVNIVSWLLTDYHFKQSDMIPEIVDAEGKTTPCFAAKEAPNGSPGPARTRFPSTRTCPDKIFPANAPIIPTTAAETITRCPASNFRATPTPCFAAKEAYAGEWGYLKK